MVFSTTFLEFKELINEVLEHIVSERQECYFKQDEMNLARKKLHVAMFVLLFKSHAYEESRGLLTHALGVALST